MTRKTYCGNLLWQSSLTLLPTLGRNMAWLLKNLKRGDATPRSADEPWQPMHFIR